MYTIYPIHAYIYPGGSREGGVGTILDVLKLHRVEMDIVWSDGSDRDSTCHPTGCTEGGLAVCWALERARAVFECTNM